MEERYKTFLFWSTICVLCFVGIPIHLKGKSDSVLEQSFQNFTRAYNKSYQNSEYDERLKHFKRSMEQIKALNAKTSGLLLSSADGNDVSTNELDGESRSHKKSHKQWHEGMPKNQGYATWGVTKFTDISPEEFQTKFLDPTLVSRIQSRQGKNSHHSHHGHHVEGNHEDESEDNLITRRKRAVAATSDFAGLPVKVDYRSKGVVTPVKHQQNCGACWAFSTIETVESMHALQKGALQTLSVQQVIDCATNGNMGCNGGDTCSALSWMKSVSLVTESEYPLTLQDGVCKPPKASAGVKIVGNFTCENLVGSEKKVLSILANHGPVVAAVDATNWQFYVGGVIQWNCDANNNHAIQIVGYDTTATPPHYIVRNSWGTDFGDNGYLYVAIGKNLCGIAREVSSLTVQ